MRVAAVALVFVSLLVTSTAQAQVFTNGPFVTHPGAGAGGTDASVLQTSLGLNVFGFNANMSGYRVAEDFVLSSATEVSKFRFFAYQTNSTTTSTFTDLYFQVWTGRPGDVGSSVLYGDLATNRLTDTGFSGIYRVLETGMTNTARPVMYVDGSANLTLGAGTYWLEWAFAGSLALGNPFVPPVTILGQTTTGNARQYIAGTDTWQDARDSVTGTHQGLPFEIYGTTPGTTVTPEPMTLLLLATGLGGLGALRRRRRQS